nr:CaiB/BaiF CoA-transferase family protein [Caulobacter sp. 17J65-9]
MEPRVRSGPLTGVRVLEFAGLGPAPFCGMLLSDLGADVVRIDRKGGASLLGRYDVTARGRRSVAFDLKQPASIEACLQLCERADALIEGYRPGVMERLGLGPDVVLGRNPKLVYGRMTGWGQSGPLAPRAGHDMNYLALTGALHAIGTEDKPVPPLNLAADYGGGALYLAFGLLAGVISARETGRGQVIDCAMTDGAASLMSVMWGLKAAGMWRDERRANLLDGGAPFYDTYQCADGEWLSVAPIEPQFFAVLLEKTGVSDVDPARQNDPSAWPDQRERLAALFRTRTRDEWRALLEDTDACVAPVLSMAEAPAHPHNLARETYVEREGIVQPAPAPRFSATPGAIQGPPPEIGQHTREALLGWGFDPADLDRLADQGAI